MTEEYLILNSNNNIVAIVSERNEMRALIHAHYCGYTRGVRAVLKNKKSNLEESLDYPFNSVEDEFNSSE